MIKTDLKLERSNLLKILCINDSIIEGLQNMAILTLNILLPALFHDISYRKLQDIIGPSSQPFRHSLNSVVLKLGVHGRLGIMNLLYHLGDMDWMI